MSKYKSIKLIRVTSWWRVRQLYHNAVSYFAPLVWVWLTFKYQRENRKMEEADQKLSEAKKEEGTEEEEESGLIALLWICQGKQTNFNLLCPFFLFSFFLFFFFSFSFYIWLTLSHHLRLSSHAQSVHQVISFGYPIIPVVWYWGRRSSGPLLVEPKAIRRCLI